MTIITRTGSRNITGLPFLGPQGLGIDFVDKRGEKYNFAFNTTGAAGATFPVGSTASGEGKVTGGRVGGKQYTGSAFVLYFVATGCMLKPFE